MDQERFGSTYHYEPKWEKDVERSPDKQPSSSAMHIEDRGTDVIWALSVRNLGALVLRAEGGEFKGLSLFTTDDLLFD